MVDSSPHTNYDYPTSHINKGWEAKYKSLRAYQIPRELCNISDLGCFPNTGSG
jgi:hypothetical protein